MTGAALLAQAARRSLSAGAHRPRVVVWLPPAPRSRFPQLLGAATLPEQVIAIPVDPPDLPSVVEAASGGGVDVVFHLHWTSWALGRSEGSPAERSLVAALDVIDALGDRSLIWTVHNALPHECREVELESRLRRTLVERAAVIHIMNPATPEVVAPWYALDPSKTIVSPHPVPPVTGIGREEAARFLELDPGVQWVAHIGQIRPYKGLDLLLEALDLLDPRIGLIVAGEPGTDANSQQQATTAALHPRVHARLSFQTDDQLEAAMAAARVVALPYRQVLNSGVLELAKAVGRPAVLPDLPHVRAMAQDAGAAFYQPGDPPALAEAITSVMSRAATVTPAGPADHSALAAAVSRLWLTE